MISLDNRPVEVVEPASPPASSSALSLASPPASPEIRVTDTPSPPPPSTAPSLPSPASPTSASFTTAATAHLLFQPFLPTSSPSSPASSGVSPRPHHLLQEHHQPKQRALPFSIDNILKPNFGQSLFAIQQGLAAASAIAAVHQQQLQQLQQQQQQQQQRQQQLKATESLKRERKISSPRLSPSNGITASNNNSSSSNGGGPVDLSSKQQPQSPVSNDGSNKSSSGEKDGKDGDLPPGMVRGPNGQLWPAWVFCTRYSDRPSSGPRARKIKKRDRTSTAASNGNSNSSDEKRPRTAFSAEQLARLRREFEENRYLTEERRRSLATDLGLNETQIKIWFQNKRAKLKKASGEKGDLAKMLAAQGLYNHATVPVDEDEFMG